MLYIRYFKQKRQRKDRKIDKIESMTKKGRQKFWAAKNKKWKSFPLKSHWKIWAAKFFPSPQARRQVSANARMLHADCSGESGDIDTNRHRHRHTHTHMHTHTRRQAVTLATRKPY